MIRKKNWVKKNEQNKIQKAQKMSNLELKKNKNEQK
jgi:hypothetical protein